MDCYFCKEEYRYRDSCKYAIKQNCDQEYPKQPVLCVKTVKWKRGLIANPHQRSARISADVPIFVRQRKKNKYAGSMRKIQHVSSSGKAETSLTTVFAQCGLKNLIHSDMWNSCQKTETSDGSLEQCYCTGHLCNYAITIHKRFQGSVAVLLTLLLYLLGHST